MKHRMVSAVLGMVFMVNSARAANPSATVQTAATASNAFAMDLYQQVARHDGNVCISPYSINTALDMTAAGAAGNTASQMLQVLHWSNGMDTLADAASALASAIQPPAPTTQPGEADGHRTELTIANALFGQTGFSYRQDFSDLLARQYGGGLQNVDFSGQPQQAADQINKWAAAQTHDRIKEALPVSAITPLTRLVLVNAIYFKAEWLEHFDKLATVDAPFSVEGKEAVTVPLMQIKHAYNYFENDSVQVMEMPYQGDYSLLVALPRQHDGLPALEKTLSSDMLNNWLVKLSPQLLQVSLPRFKLEGSFELKDSLSNMGMRDAFDAKTADFSGISSSERLKIDSIIHKTFIQVDEAGTEAAAVTSVAMGLMSVMTEHPEEPVVFRADHAFIYMVKQRSTGTILFMGRVSNPS